MAIAKVQVGMQRPSNLFVFCMIAICPNRLQWTLFPCISQIHLLDQVVVELGTHSQGTNYHIPFWNHTLLRFQKIQGKRTESGKFGNDRGYAVI